MDIYGALSEYIGMCVSGDTVTLLDINNSVPPYLYDEDIKGRFDYKLTDTFMGFHCGNTPSCKMCSGRAVKYQLIQNRLLENGGNFFVANAYLDGTYSEVYPNISRDEEGMKKLFKQFSFPGGISSHVAPETPGSINEGGELGYSIAHAFGAVFDNPGLIAAVTVGDGEAETGPLAQLEAWLRSYRPEELFDENGTLRPELQALAPTGDRRIAANPHANGGKLLRDLRTPDFRKYAVDIPYPGSVEKQDMIELKVRVVNVVDLMKLEPSAKHPHGLTDADYDALFTRDKPIIFAFHGYPTLIHELTYERANRNLSVHGYQEEGTITTPFDMREQNEIDRFHLVKDAVQHLPQLGNRGGYLIQQMNDKLVEHKNYIHEVGQDLPEILDWK